jgi:hypothetical protein
MLTLPPKASFSLRRILVVSLLLFALLPAACVTWLLARSSNASVAGLANDVMGNVALRIQAETESHLEQAQIIMNGLFPATLTKQQTRQARDWLEQPALFEPLAFALTRQSSSVPFLYLATVRGNFFGVEQTPHGAVVSVREVRDGQANRRQFFLAGQPGDRSRPLEAEVDSYEPRTRSWYESRYRRSKSNWLSRSHNRCMTISPVPRAYLPPTSACSGWPTFCAHSASVRTVRLTWWTIGDCWSLRQQETHCTVTRAVCCRA